MSLPLSDVQCKPHSSATIICRQYTLQAAEVGAVAAFTPSCSRAEMEGQSTLERRRQCHHDSTDPALHPAFPHLYQAASGRPCHTPHGSQYCLAQCPAPLAGSSPSHSQQGTLRRDSQKVRSGPSSHLCQMHESQPARDPYPGQVEAAHRGCRRKEVGGGEVGDQEEPLTPNTARKNKRESAV